MTIQLYELAGAEEDRRFSPYCWRARMALSHKGLTFEGVPWRFTDKATIAFSGQGRVPVLVDGNRTISDSWNIALYLEEAYPDRPSLFCGPVGCALSRFYVDWVDTVVHAGLIRLIAADIHAHLHERDKAYFRRTREERFGTTLEALCADREQRVGEFRQSLAPLRATVQRQPYLGGDAPLFADYVVFGAFQWTRTISPFPVLENADPVAAWCDRLLFQLDDEARQLKAYNSRSSVTNVDQAG